jgi:hypothetical protein
MGILIDRSRKDRGSIPVEPLALLNDLYEGGYFAAYSTLDTSAKDLVPSARPTVMVAINGG